MPRTREELYTEAQHLHRRREELESQIAGLCLKDSLSLVRTVRFLGEVDAHVADLAYAAVQLALDEKHLVEELGVGWRSTSTGIMYHPFEGEWPVA